MRDLILVLCDASITICATMPTVKLIIQEVAKKKGIGNPFALAAATGLNYAICYRLWNGNQQRVDLKTLARLCKALDAKPGQFFEYKSGDNP